MLEEILSGLNEATARSLKRLAWRQGLTLSDFVFQVLEDHVNRRVEPASHVSVRSCRAPEN